MAEALLAARPGASALRRVCIAIPTYRRPMLLDRLLTGIATLNVPPDTAVEIVVVDNDPLESARALVAARTTAFRFPLAYEPVAEPGLSSVRNFALTYANGRCALLAMIDDDEAPQPQWLAELLRVREATGADAVVGPVPHLLPSEAPRWLREGPFFDLPVYADQESMTDGYSGNCLLSVDAVARLGLRFDPGAELRGRRGSVVLPPVVARRRSPRLRGQRRRGRGGRHRARHAVLPASAELPARQHARSVRPAAPRWRPRADGPRAEGVRARRARPADRRSPGRSAGEDRRRDRAVRRSRTGSAD